jgi:hypothetical protein
MAAALLVIGTGCGGFNATPAFNPLMLFLPGIADNKQKPAQPPEKPAQVASNRELALQN